MKSMLPQIYFWVCALMAIAGALVTVIAKNPIRGAMGLLLTIGGIAAMFLSLQAEFLAAAQVLVYAGAVVILFLFVIMLLGADAQPDPSMEGMGTRVAAGVGMAIISGAGIWTMVAVGAQKVASGQVPGARTPGLANAAHTATRWGFHKVAADHGSIEQISQAVFGKGIVPFELSGALLIVAVVGAVAVARGRQGVAAKDKQPRIAPTDERRGPIRKRGAQ